MNKYKYWVRVISVPDTVVGTYEWKNTNLCSDEAYILEEKNHMQKEDRQSHDLVEITKTESN